MLDIVFAPLNNINETSEYYSLYQRYTIKNSLFYDLVGKANKVAQIDIETINVRDLFFLVAVNTKHVYGDTLAHKKQERDLRENSLKNRVARRR